jgi:CHAT domain-containing protein/tetratricopeptide (TPR) repeat protein
MTEAAIRLAAALARCDSAEQSMSLLVGAPVLSPPDLMEVARHPEEYGIPSDEAQHLRQIEGWLAKVLQGLTGDLDPAAPAGFYRQLAITCRRQGKREQAKRFYQYSFANAASPADKAGALSGVAILELEQGHVDRARTIFLQARDICTHGDVSGEMLADILSNLGQVEMEAKQWTAAAELFEKTRNIGRDERIPEVYALARINEAEMARRQGDRAAAARCLDDIRWIEGSGSQREADYQTVRRSLGDAPEEELPDPESQTIEELEWRLWSGGGNISATADADRAQVEKALGGKYYARHDGPRIENVKAAVKYWEAALAFVEKGEIAGKPLREIVEANTMHAMVVELHGDLGLAYNEWYALDRESASAGKAREHFEAALQELPQGAEFADYRRALLNNLANAMAWEARTGSSLLVAGQPDVNALRKSLDVQAQLVQELGEDPAGRCQVLINLSQTYVELADTFPDAGRDAYYPAAWDCATAAEKALNEIDHPGMDLVLGVAIKLAQTAADMGRQPVELAQLQARLDGLLRRENLASVAPTVWSVGFRQSARLAWLLGEKARSYRRLLTGMRMLRARIASGPVALDLAVADLYRTNTELVRSLVEWGELDRALFFAGTAPGERARAYPKGGRARAAERECAIVFRVLSTNRLGAFAIREDGVKFRELPIEPMELIRADAQFLSARIDGDKGAAVSSDAWLAAIAWVSGLMGEKLFRPIEDLLPESGRLTLLPDFSVMSVLPLHLASLRGGKRVLDRFEVTYCSELRFADGDGAGGEKPQADGVFIASYSPKAARLPFAALEARGVVECYAGARIATGESGTPAAVLAGLEKSRVAHLCSHGYFDWQSPLDSKLVLAGGELSLREIQLSLARSPCDLIVLSACEAGSRDGNPRERSDFASILLRAGCRFVIAADWRIDDLSTMLLLALVHESLAKGAGAAEALAAAQRRMQTEPGAAMAARGYRWLGQCAQELTPDEQAYVREKLDALAASGKAAVFADPVYWAPFSASAECFRLEREARALASGAGR